MTAVGALDDLREVAGLNPLSPETQPCPHLGETVDVQGFSPHIWGDVNCDGAVDAVDALALLRNVAGLSPLAQHGPCPVIGAQVSFLQ